MEIIERRAFLKCFDGSASYNAEITRVTLPYTMKKSERQGSVADELGHI